MKRRSRESRKTRSDEGRNPHLIVNSRLHDYVTGYFTSNPTGLNLPRGQRLYFRVVHSAKGTTGRSFIQFSISGNTFVDVLKSDEPLILPETLELLNATSSDGMKEAEDVSAPPRFAEYLLYLFIPKLQRQNLLGDLQEEYLEVSERFGKKRATFWFYKQVGTSLWPLFRRSIIKGWLYGLAAEVIHRVFY